MALKGAGGRAITLRNVSKGTINDVRKNTSNYTEPALVLDNQSTMYAASNTNDIATTVRFGKWDHATVPDNTNPPIDVAYSGVKTTPFILPAASTIADQTYLKGGKLCSLTWSETAIATPAYPSQ